MKKQGKVWSTKGLESMLKLIESRVNGKLNEYLRCGLRRLQELQIKVPLESLKTLSATQLGGKHHEVHVGAVFGRIPVNASTSSSFGAMAKRIQANYYV